MTSSITQVDCASDDIGTILGKVPWHKFHAWDQIQYKVVTKFILILKVFEGFVVLKCIIYYGLNDQIMPGLPLNMLPASLFVQDSRAVPQCGVSSVWKLQPPCTMWCRHGSGHLLRWDGQQGNKHFPNRPVIFKLYFPFHKLDHQHIL